MDRTDHQGKENKQAPEKIFSASKQDDQTLFEDLDSNKAHNLNPSKNLMGQSNCCSQKYQVDPVNFNHMPKRFQWTIIRQQDNNLEEEVICCLDNFLELVKDTLVSH